jgi:thiamine-phosphate pyrophosphorylase
MSCSLEACCGNLRTPLPLERKPILCYVTSRRALEPASAPSPGDPISPNSRTDPTHALLETIRKAAAAGINWIQIREKHLGTLALAELVRLAGAATRETGARILVNDRLDVALAAGAAGVHLGEMSLPVKTVAEWRRAAGRVEFRIGVSCHSVEAAREADVAGADYIFFGPVFATPSKAEFGAPQGVGRLREVCRAVRIPVLAIGGVTVENAHSCFAAGAAGVAAIRLFQESEDVSAVVSRLREPGKKPLV